MFLTRGRLQNDSLEIEADTVVNSQKKDSLKIAKIYVSEGTTFNIDKSNNIEIVYIKNTKEKHKTIVNNPERLAKKTADKQSTSLIISLEKKTLKTTNEKKKLFANTTSSILLHFTSSKVNSIIRNNNLIYLPKLTITKVKTLNSDENYKKGTLVYNPSFAKSDLYNLSYDVRPPPTLNI